MGTLIATASSVTTSSGTEPTLSGIRHPETYRGGVFQLNVTPSSSGTASQLSVYVQSAVDSTNYSDFVALVAESTSGSGQYRAHWFRDYTPTTAVTTGMSELALTDNTVLQGPQGNEWRVMHTVTATSGPMSYSLYFSGYR